MPKAKQPAVMALFRTPQALLDAVRSVRERGYRGIDALTPYPVHGLPEALGLKVSWMPRITKTFFFVGAGLGFYFEYWTMAVTWPINVAGKPYFSIPAFMPVTFECGILTTGILTFLALFAADRLRPKPSFKAIDPRITNDRFALLIPTGFEGPAPATRLLEEMGALEVRELHV